MKKSALMPYKLQFFAEGEGESEGENNEVKETLTVEELQTQLEIQKNAAENAEAMRKKDKEALDKALKEVARLTKEARANKTEAEIEAENKRVEAEAIKEELSNLREYKRKTEAKERYLMQGMTPEMATKASEAEVAGDMDALTILQRQHTEGLIKAKEAEWKKTMPNPSVGIGSYPAMTKEEILQIEDTEERVLAIAQHPELFK